MFSRTSCGCLSASAAFGVCQSASIICPFIRHLVLTHFVVDIVNCSCTRPCSPFGLAHLSRYTTGLLLMASHQRCGTANAKHYCRSSRTGSFSPCGTRQVSFSAFTVNRRSSFVQNVNLSLPFEQSNSAQSLRAVRQCSPNRRK